MRLAVIGATGWIGGLAAAEALDRGHEVTALVRETGRAGAVDERAGTAVAPLGDPDALAEALPGHDAVLGAYRAPSESPEEMPAAARSLVDAARRAGVGRVVWVGSTATLPVPGGEGDIVDVPQFPEEWRPAGLAHRESLNLLRAEAADLDWTYVCPPTGIAPGERTGAYRVARDQLLLDDEGQSRISAEDFALALVDLLEGGDYARDRITVAY